MSRYTEQLKTDNIPVLPLRTGVLFPMIPLSLQLSRDIDIKACEYADASSGEIFCVLQKSIADDDPGTSGFESVGCVAKIKQLVSLPEGGSRVLLEGKSRAMLLSASFDTDHYFAEIMAKTVHMRDPDIRLEALKREVINIFDEITEYMKKYSEDLIIAVKTIDDPSLFCDFVAVNLLMKLEDKQKILEEFNPDERLLDLIVMLRRELRIIKTEYSIHKRVKTQMENNQREYYLKEQLKAIQSELGYTSEDDTDYDEIDEYESRIKNASLPDYAEKKLLKELKRLEKIPFNSADAAVLRNYLDICLELPWNVSTDDTVDIEKARKILDADHDGLEKVKERILEFLAVKQLNPGLDNQIICLVGPPGTGKTSIAQSLAVSMNRKYVRVSLGGVRDEADIRGHRKTYVASMPGRIISALAQAGVNNPLMLLDEVDKLSHSMQGDPSSALLEVLDGEQNKAFRDHFIEIPFDLSKCVFICTANTLETVPRPLIDRMEIIELKTYSRTEKLAIAKHHLIRKQRAAHGLSGNQIRFTDKAIYEIIDRYTREAGVRNLNREIASVCRKVAKGIVEKKYERVTVTDKNIVDFLGKRKIKPESTDTEPTVGVVNGLAYTETGGDMLKIEAVTMNGSGKIELTGSLGDVMKESAKTAVGYIRSNAEKLGVDPDFYKTKDIHIHVPEGAVPKDGPSAGVTILTALTSRLTNTPMPQDIAMTGEITLTGRVLPIGGLKEKTMAAYSAGIRTVLIPKDNVDDLDEIDKEAKEHLAFIPCKDAGDVLANALNITI